MKLELYCLTADTDYNNYAVIFSCNNYFGLANGQNVWILSRRKVLEPQFVERAMAILSMNSISKLMLKHIDQNCESPNAYAPPPNNGNSYYGRK